MNRRESERTVLIVDDHVDNLRVLGEILRTRGYRVRTAVSGAHALQSVRALPPDLILLDVRMPGIDGFEVCRRLREDERTCDIPILFLSAVAGADSKVEAFACGGVDYITKPFQTEEVLSRVETHLSLRALRQDLEARVRERTSELEEAARRLGAEVAERERLTAILESTSDLVATARPSGEVSFMNRAGRRLVGWADDERLEGRTIWEIHPAEARRTVLDVGVPEAIRTGIWEGEAAIRDGTGREIPVSQVLMAHRGWDGELRYLSTIARDIRDRKRAEERLRFLAERLRRLGARTLEMEEEERKRIARDIHDLVGQKLTALGIALQRITVRSEGSGFDGTFASLVREAQSLLKETAEDLHAVMSDLRPAVLDDYGIRAAIHWHAARFSSRTGIPVYVGGSDLSPRLQANVEIALYRATLEALNNAAKHGNPSAIEIHVESDPRTTRVTICDDGCGFDPAHVPPPGDEGGWGLLGMAERIERVGGRLQIDAAPGRGTTIRLEVST